MCMGGGTTSIVGGTITTSAAGANGTFSYGANSGQTNATGDGTTVYVKDVTITTSAQGSGGIMTTYGGTTVAENLTITTEGGSSAPIRTDRGGGWVTVTGGSYTSNGLGSPAIYSTAEITVNDATLTSNQSEGVCIEGAGSIALSNCTLTANNTATNGNATFYDTIMIYQSQSGDASDGTSEFSMTGGTLNSQSGHVFHVTNTTATINLDGVTINNSDDEGILLSVCDDGWSGADNIATLNASNQTLTGDILVGSDSTLTLNLENSTFTGNISGEITNASGDTVSTTVGTVNVTLDDDSKWYLTGDTYISTFSGDAANVINNGFTLYKNAVAVDGTTDSGDDSMNTNEYQVVGGIRYTALEDNTVLQTSNDTVTGITSGKVVATIDGASTTPNITIDGSTAFTFTNTVDSSGYMNFEFGGGNFQIGDMSFHYVSGDITYTANSMTFSSSNPPVFSMTGDYSSLMGTLNLSLPNDITVPIENGIMTFNLTGTSTATLSGGLASGSMSFEGEAEYDTNNKTLILTKDAHFNIDATALIYSIDFDLVAAEDTTLAFDDGNFIIQDGGSVEITGDTFVSNGTFAVSGGNLSFDYESALSTGSTFGTVTTLTLDAGAVLTFTADGLTNSVTVTAGSSNDAVITMQSDRFLVTSGSDSYEVLFSGSGDTALNITNSDSNTLITATSLNDTINNTASNVTIDASEGDDSINNNTQGRYVSIDAGAGNDSITNAANCRYVTIDGGDDDDYIENSSQNVSINGGAGNDTIYSSNSNNTIDAGAGNNIISLSSGSGNVIISSGNDTLYNYSSSRGTIQAEISSSTVEGDNVILTTADGTLTIVDGKDATLNLNGTESVISGDTGDEVCKIGDVTYTSLQDAADAASSGDTITLSKNITLTETLDFGEASVTLDLNGYTISGEVTQNGLINIGASPTVTITGGTVTNNGSMTIHVKGNLVVEDATITSNIADDGTYEAAIYNYGNVTVTNSSVSYFVNEGDSFTFTGTSGNDSINGTGNNITVIASAGNDTISEIPADIQATVTSSTVSGDDVVLTTADGTITILDAKGETLNLNGVETVFSDSTAEEPLNISNTDSNTLITATSLNDTINNSAANVTIDAGAGTDSITNSGESVSISAGADNDTINNSGANVTVDAGDGDNSVVYAYTENGSINAGSGDDTITAIEAANVYINAGSGDNYVFNGFVYNDASNNLVDKEQEAADTSSTIISGAGNDVIVNQGIYNGSINAGNGDNVVSIYHSYKNTITTGTGDDTVDIARGGSLGVYTGGGDDSIIGHLATIQTTDFDNWAFGGYATIDAGAGDDYIAPLYSDNSSIYGGAGNDTIINNGANTTINGGAGNDYIELTDDSTGEYEAQVIIASAGDDTLVGATSNTSIQGSFTAATVDGSDVVLTTSSGTLTIKDSAGETLNINGAESVISGETDTTNTLAAYLADFALHKTSAGYPQMAALAFHPTEANPDAPTNYYSSETWTATSADDLALSAVHYSPENPTGKWVILVHGYGKVGAAMNDFAAPYLAQGVDVLIVDQRAAGNSEGEWLTMGVAESADLAVWTQEISKTNSNAQITLHGVSMGAATVMLGAALSQITNVTGIIEDCGYSDISAVFNTVLSAYGAAFGITGDVTELIEDTFEVGESLTGYDVAQATPLDVIAQVTVPSLFIHGADDPVIPVSVANELYNTSGSVDKTLVTISGAGHAESGETDSETYFAAVTTLLEDSTEEIGADINSTVDNKLIRGTIYDDTISATGENVSIDGISGNDTISYSATADILFDAEQVTVDGDNVVLTNGDNSVTILDAKDKTIILNGVETVISGEVVPLEISNDKKSTLITATSLDDTITNTGKKVTIDSGAGNDSITNSGNKVSIVASTGNDTVNNTGNNVTVNAGDGDNTVEYTGTSRGSIVAGGGNDSITAIDSDNISINTGDGDNYVLNAFAYYDSEGNFVAKNDNPNKSTKSTVIGGSGNDTITNQGINNGKIDAGEGDNYIELYHSYSNTVTTGAGADSVIVSKGSSINVYTGEGDDSIIGRLGEIEDDDWSFGGYATIDAGAGDDYIAPLYSDNSSIFGGAGNDTIIINGENTTINGGDGNDYIELTDDSTGEYEAAVVVASAGNDTVVNYSSVVTLQGEFTTSFYSGNDVILKTSTGYLTVIDGKDATLNINGTESVIGGDNAMEVITINGIIYTIGDGAELTYDTEGNVTGIASGTVTAELADTGTSPVITLDGTTAFDFTATAEDGALKMQVGNDSISYTSGNVTYTADDITFEESTAEATASISINDDTDIELTIPASGGTISITDGEISLAAGFALTKTFDSGNIVTVTANVDDYGEIKINDDGSISVTPESTDAVTVAETFTFGAVYNFNNITGTLNISDNVIAVDEGTASGNLSVFGNESTLAFTAVDGSGSATVGGRQSTYAAEDGATFTVQNEDNVMTINGGGSIISQLVSGAHAISLDAGINLTSVSDFKFVLTDIGTYTLNGNTVTTEKENVEVYLPNGDTIIFELADDRTLTITPNTEDSGTITVDENGGVTLAPTATDSMNVLLDVGNDVIHNYTSIDSSLTFSGNYVIFNGDTSIAGNVLVNNEERPFHYEVEGETASLELTSNGNIISCTDGTTLTGEVNNAGSVIITGEGSVSIEVDDSRTYHNAYLSEDITMTSAAEAYHFILPTAATYNVNGLELTSTAENTTIYLSNHDTVTFDTDEDIIFEGLNISGSVTINDSNILQISEGNSATINGITYTAIDGDAQLSFADSNITSITSGKVSAAFNDAVVIFDSTDAPFDFSLETNGDNLVATVNDISFEYSSGTTTYTAENVIWGAGAEFSFTDSDISLSANSDSSFALSTVDGGISFVANDSDNSLAYTVTNGSDTYSADLNFSGDIVFNSDTTFTLNDGATLAVTTPEIPFTFISSADNGGTVAITPENGIEAQINGSETLEIDWLTTFGLTYYANQNQPGAITYKDSVLTIKDGTSLAGTTSNTMGAVFNFDAIDADGTATYTTGHVAYRPGEGGKFTFGSVTLSEGCCHVYYNSSMSYKGTTYRTAFVFDENAAIEFEQITEGYARTVFFYGGEYDVLGYTLSNEDIVQGRLMGEKTFGFMAEDEVTFNGMDFSGAGLVICDNGVITLPDGVEVSNVATGSEFVMTESGTVVINGTTFKLNEDLEDGITITVTDDGYSVSHIITADEVAKYGDPESDIGKTFTENLSIEGDDEYTVTAHSMGITIVSGISDDAKINVTAEKDGETYENGTGFTFITDEAGTVTFGENSYTVSDDESVVLDVSFDNDGNATLNSVDDLTGNISGDFNGERTINETEITISAGADNASISADSESVTVSAVESGAEVTFDSSNTFVKVEDSMTVNEITYNVAGDSDGVIVGQEVTDLDENASLTVSEAGNYTVNTTALKVAEGDVVVGLTDTYAYIAGDEIFNSNTTTSEILEALDVEESDATIIPSTASGNQRATLPADGGLAIIEDTKAPVTIVGGRGDDTIVSKGDDVLFNMVRGGDDKIIALDGTLKLENYDPRSDAGIQLTTDDIKDGFKFGDGQIELANANVELSNNFVNLYDLAGNKNLIGFATNEDKRVDASELTEGISIIGGGDNASSNISNATLIGGSGDDSIYSGDSANISPGEGNNYIELDGTKSTINYGGGNDTIEGFNFADSNNADKIHNAEVTDVAVDNGNVVLTTEDGNITVNDAENKDIALDNDVTLQVGENEIKFDGVANQYWATGEKATVKVDEDYAGTSAPVIALDEMSGDIKDVDASAYEGTAEITGNSESNVISASKGGSTMDGGAGDDKLIGGDGADEFISAAGDDTISNFEFGTEKTADTFNAGETSVNKVKVDGEDVILITDNGSAQIENAAGQTMQFKSEHTNNDVITAQFDTGTVTVNDDANFYWVAGNSASIAVSEDVDSKTTLVLDLSNADYNNADQRSFYGDIKEIDASTFEGTASLKGNDKNNIITASEGGSTLNGGARNDKLIGGDGVDTFVYEKGNGKDTVSNFEFGTGKTSDILNIGDNEISTVKIYDDDVILEFDGGLVKVEGGAGQIIQLQDANNEITATQFAKDTITMNEDASLFWVTGKNATMSLEDLTSKTVTVDFRNSSGSSENEESSLVRGDIRTIDGTGYKGALTIYGSDKNNVLIGGNGNSTLWGGDGTSNDTLIGGSGADTFIYSKNNGKDVVQGATSKDTVKLDGITLDDLKALGDDLIIGNDVKFEIKGGGSLTVQDAKTSGVTFDVDGTKYAVNRSTGEWEFK